jgi:hypothetical protein
MEHSTTKWDVHFLGAMNVIASFGGFDKFAASYPHLRLILAQNSHFETMHLILSPISITTAKQASRQVTRALCYDTAVSRAYFISSPPRLTLALYDIGVCARRILSHKSPITVTDGNERDNILLEVLSFQPEEGIEALLETYFQGTIM